MSWIALLLAFASAEHVLLTYGTGIPASSALATGTKRIYRVMTFVYLLLAGLLGWLGAWLTIDQLAMPFLATLVFALVAFFLPLGVRRVFETWSEDARGWERARHYSIAAAVVLMYVLHQYHLAVYEVAVASAAGALGYLLLITLFQGIMERLSFETIPVRFRGLPLSFIVLGLIGLACLGLDAALWPAFWAVFRT